MTHDGDSVQLQNYMSVQEAADILNLSTTTVYEYANNGKLDSIKVGGGVGILKESVHSFRSNSPGRIRTNPPSWRKYNPRSNVFATEIHVRIRSGRQQQFLDALQTIREEKLHTFKGSIARYVVKDRDDHYLMRIVLIWKDTEMPDREEHEQEIKAFQDELADVLDWETARYEDGEGLIYT